jgi:hypothetical protein
MTIKLNKPMASWRQEFTKPAWLLSLHRIRRHEMHEALLRALLTQGSTDITDKDKKITELLEEAH